MRDFTPKGIEPFQLYDVVMQPLPDITLEALKYLSNMDDSITDRGEMMASFVGFLELVLDDESGTELRKMITDRKRVIGLETLHEIMAYVMEGYGMRPTVQSSNSAESSEDVVGTSSMAGVEVAA